MLSKNGGNEMKYKDKAVLITGATRGIGFATAKVFLKQGASIAVNGRTAESVKKAMEKLGKSDRIVPSPGDVGAVADCESVVRNAVEKLGGLDILVNAAGVCQSADIEGSDEALWDYMLDINLKGTFFCSKLAIPALRITNGVIINLASDAGLLGERNLAIYCASKGGVVNLTRAMALELAPDIRVNCICPGYVDTDMVRRDYIEKTDDPEAAAQRLKAFAPMKRIATPEEIAHAVSYLSSCEARFITGSALQIDGGTTAGH
jgi:NAD(P)-dependent dehydrogenase (short-subunit alcohol dehydrogenase family)